MSFCHIIVASTWKTKMLSMNKKFYQKHKNSRKFFDETPYIPSSQDKNIQFPSFFFSISIKKPTQRLCEAHDWHHYLKHRLSRYYWFAIPIVGRLAGDCFLFCVSSLDRVVWVDVSAHWRLSSSFYRRLLVPLWSNLAVCPIESFDWRLVLECRLVKKRIR